MSKISSDNPRQFARMHGLLSKLLLYGVLVSTVIIIFGLVLMEASNTTGYACDSSGDSLNCLLSYNANTIPHADYPTNLSALVSGLEQLKPFSIIALGVIVLLATPALRVFTSLVVFAVERDKPFVIITIFVFLVLMFSFFVVPGISLFKA